MKQPTDNIPPNTASSKETASSSTFSLLRVFSALRDFGRSTMNLADDMDLEGTIDTIKKDMIFRGHVVWILVCSIFIASIGLNLNSTAVVIGAMLISPLMGPILAIGLSVGTNDWDTLIKALKNFGIMVVLALITSTIYFFITPLHEVQPELLSRTKPTFLDALIGIFGGLAGIIGVSRSNRSNVIPGVAIATALMPPLCTAGFGLANGEWSFFFGAFYLFTLNSIFIAGATFIIVRYLKFPLVSFVNAATEKKVKRYMLFFVFLVLLPSAWIFYGLVKETIFQGRANNFIAQNFSIEGTEIVSRKITYTDTVSRIDIFIMGEPISEEMKRQLQRRMLEEKIENTVLRIHQPKDVTGDIAGKLSKEVRVGILEDLYQRNEQAMAKKDLLIQKLQAKMKNYRKDSFPLAGITDEIRTLYPHIERVSYAPSVEINNAKPDTIPTFLIGWKSASSQSEKQKNKQVLGIWLKQRLALDTLRIIEY